jgi:two-component system LytT family response regulator
VQPDRLRLLIADDEPLARALVRQYASTDAGLEVVGEAATGDELSDALTHERPDVALVDIRMPGADVFDVLADAAARQPPLPAVIFSTAFDAYAVRAFELNAVDYLIKPYSADRFREALRRARRHRADDDGGLVRAIRDLGPRPERLLVPDGRRMIPLAIEDVVWIEAEGDYVRVHARGRGYFLTRTMKELESRLDPGRFLRVHRSAIVQASHIREVQPSRGSRYRLLLSDGTTVIVSRSRAPELKKWKL